MLIALLIRRRRSVMDHDAGKVEKGILKLLCYSGNLPTILKTRGVV